MLPFEPFLDEMEGEEGLRNWVGVGLGSGVGECYEGRGVELMSWDWRIVLALD